MSTDAAWGGNPADNADAWSMDGSEYSQEDLGGSWVKMPGSYHFEIYDVKRDLAATNKDGKDKSPSIVFCMGVVHGVEGQSPFGAKFNHSIYLGAAGGGPPKEGSKKSALRFGIALGLLKEITVDGRSMIVDAATGQPKITLETWDRAKHEQIIGKIEFRAKDPKDAKSIDKHDFAYDGVFHVLDPAVRSVPKSYELVELKYGKEAADIACGRAPGSPPPPPASPPAANGTSQPPSAPPAPAGMAVNDF